MLSDGWLLYFWSSIHLLNLIRESDRTDQVLSQQVGDLFRIVRVSSRQSIREYGQAWRLQLNSRERFSKPMLCLRDDWRMKGAGNLEAPRLNAVARQPLDCQRDGLPRP